MSLSMCLPAVAGFTPEKFEDLRRNLDPQWIQQALHATGTASVRTRRLPAQQVVWLVIGMALMRNRSIHDVVTKLDLVLAGASPSVAPSTVAQARARLGAEPMEWLFTVSATHWAHDSAEQHRWRGLAVYGVDGTTLRVPDSPDNAQAFGYAPSSRGASAYPMVRAVALMALRSHLLAAVAFGPYETSELAYSKELWASVPSQSLTILDRAFFAAGVLIPLHRDGQERHWLTRAKSNLKWRVLKRLGPNDSLIEMTVSKEALKKDPSLPKTWVLRAVTYQRKGYRPQILLTSMLDAKAYPAAELAALYHERWELEVGYDEIKTEMLDREEAIRSRSAIAVRQELWGVLLAYNLVRLEMEQTANAAGIEPARLSFIGCLRMICDEWLWCAIAAPGSIPKHLRELRAALVTLLLPPRRSERRYAREVKIKMSNYSRKRR